MDWWMWFIAGIIVACDIGLELCRYRRTQRSAPEMNTGE